MVVHNLISVFFHSIHLRKKKTINHLFSSDFLCRKNILGTFLDNILNFWTFSYLSWKMQIQSIILQHLRLSTHFQCVKISLKFLQKYCNLFCILYHVFIREFSQRFSNFNLFETYKAFLRMCESLLKKKKN